MAAAGRLSATAAALPFLPNAAVAAATTAVVAAAATAAATVAAAAAAIAAAADAVATTLQRYGCLYGRADVQRHVASSCVEWRRGCRRCRRYRSRPDVADWHR